MSAIDETRAMVMPIISILDRYMISLSIRVTLYDYRTTISCPATQEKVKTQPDYGSMVLPQV